MSKARAGSIDPARFLDAVPIANRAVRVERHERTVVLYVPILKRWWMRGPLGWLLPFRNEKGVALDALGCEVWDQCDGRASVEQIVDGFARRHRLRFHEARLSVMAFLRALVERNLMVLALDAAGDHEAH